MSDDVLADAVISVDVQCGFFSGPHEIPDADIVVHIQNDGQPGSPDSVGSEGWQLFFEVSPGETVIHKSTDSAFELTALQAVLEQAGVSTVAVVGVQSEMCVSATARDAIRRGYRVVVPHDAHGTYDIPSRQGIGERVPAHVVARVAEWALGDDVIVVPTVASIRFVRPEEPDRSWR